MGTKLQTKGHLMGYHSIWGPNESVSNDILPLYRQDKAPKNCQHYESFLPQQPIADAYVGYAKEKVKQMILGHESTFRHQLQELHRLYGRQRELMNEIRGRQVKKGYGQVETLHSNTFSSYTSSEDAAPKWHGSHTALLHSLVGQMSTLDTSSLPSFRKGKSAQKCEPPSCKSDVVQTRMIDLEFPADVYMNSEGKVLEENVCALPQSGGFSATSIHGIQNYKDLKSSFCSILNNHYKDDNIRLNSCAKRNTELADLNEPSLPEESASDLAHAPSLLNDVPKAGASANSASSINFGHKHISLFPVKERNGRICLNSFRSGNESTKEQLIIDLESDVFSKASQAELTKGDEFLPSDQNKNRHHSRRKLFGVEIFEVEDKSLVTDTAFVSCTRKHDSESSTREDKVDANSGTRSISMFKEQVLNNNGLSHCSKSSANLFHGSAIVECHLPNHMMNKDSLAKIFGEKDVPKPFDGLDSLNRKSTKVLKAATSTSSVLQDDITLSAEIQNLQNNSEGTFLHCVKSEYCAEQSRSNKNSCHLNLDSLRNSCQQFFQTTKSNSIPPLISTQKQETVSSHSVQGNEDLTISRYKESTEKTTCGFTISNNLSSSDDPTFSSNSSNTICKTCDGDKAGNLLVNIANRKEDGKVNGFTLEERINNSVSGLQHHFDLNLSLIEEEGPSALSLPSSVLKIVTTEIDLEAPPVTLESEAGVCHETDVEANFSSEGTKDPHEALLRVVAEAVVAMSLSAVQVNANSASPVPLEAAPADCLKWFAEVATLCESDDEDFASKITQSVAGALNEVLIPDGLDHFEFMTLKLNDTKEENYHYKPPTLENQDDEETKVNSRRPRRGQARRGRQRKDFRRDILPGLLTLSKHDVTEDFQTFEELLRASGCDWKSSQLRKNAAKSSRGRRRTRVVTSPSVERDAGSADLEQQQLVTGEVQVEEKTLTGWGKKTRRLPRQRCMNSSPTCQL